MYIQHYHQVYFPIQGICCGVLRQYKCEGILNENMIITEKHV